MAVFDPAQVVRQCFAAGTARRRLGLGLALDGTFSAQLLERGLQGGLVLDERLLEQPALLGAHRLGLGAELPALEARELELELLQLRVAQCDLAVLALQQLLALGELAVALGQRQIVLLDALAHLRDQRAGLGGQRLQDRRGKIAHAEHAPHGAAADGIAPLAYAMSTAAR